MTRQFGAIIAVSALCVLLAGCGRFGQQDGERLVQEVGPDRIRSAAASVRSRVTPPVTHTECRDVPQNLWSEALRDLDAQRVCITGDGMMITKYAFFVEGEGLYIVFDGAELPEEGGSDPSFRRLSDRIYWFRYSG